MSLLIAIGSIASAAAAVTAGAASLTWVRGAEARAERCERAEERARAEAEAARLAKEEERRQYVERVNADPVGGMLQPVMQGIATTLIPLRDKGDHAAKFLRESRVEQGEAQVRADDENAKVPQWVDSPGLEKVAKVASWIAPFLLGLHFIFDYLVFSKMYGPVMGLACSAGASVLIVLCAGLFYFFGSQLLNPSGRTSWPRRAGWGAGLALAGVLSVFVLQWLYTVADIRGEAHSLEAIAAAQQEIDKLEVDRVNGDPLFSESKVLSAQAARDAAATAMERTKENDRRLSVGLGVAEILFVIGEIFYLAYYSPKVSPRRRAQTDLTNAQAKVQYAEGVLLTTSQEQKQAAAQFSTHIQGQFSGPDGPLSLEVFAEAFPQAVAQGLGASEMTHALVSPENERPAELASVVGSTLGDIDNSLTPARPPVPAAPAPAVPEAAPPPAPAPAPVAALDRPLEIGGFDAPAPDIAAEPAEDLPRVFGNHNHTLDELDEF